MLHKGSYVTLSEPTCWGCEDHAATPIYLRQGEEFYIYLFSNFPAPAKVYGNLVLNVLPTFR